MEESRPSVEIIVSKNYTSHSKFSVALFLEIDIILLRFIK
jgi:hypothetical protein